MDKQSDAQEEEEKQTCRSVRAMSGKRASHNQNYHVKNTKQNVGYSVEEEASVFLLIAIHELEHLGSKKEETCDEDTTDWCRCSIKCRNAPNKDEEGEEFVQVEHLWINDD